MLLALLVFLPILSAPVLFFAFRGQPEKRDNAVTVVVCAAFALSLSVSGGTFDLHGVLLYGIHLTADGFRAAYAVITALLWLGTTLFGREYFRHEAAHMDAYWFFTLLTLGATEGVMLSADFMTTFVFFEILSLTSFTWVIWEQTPEAVYAGYTYLFIAVGGGLVLFMGLALLYHACGTLYYAELREAVAGKTNLLPAAVCILLGFGAKAGMFPLHVWLPMAHPIAPSPASALLSGVLTKVGVFGILMTAAEVLWHDDSFGLLVLTLGLITMFLGALLALFSVNLKRTLACSSMSQIGFILTGVGSLVLSRAYESPEAAELAFSGTVLHMANHSLLKLVLFMAAGVVLMNLHTLSLNDIRGWGRNQTALKAAFALGALGISGVPLLNGYLSKTLLHEGLVHLAHAAPETLHPFLHASEWVFLISGGFTFAYMLKLYVCIFVEKNADPARQARYDADGPCMNRLSSAVVLGSALLLIPMGQPAVLLRLAAVMTGEPLGHFAAFALENLKGGGTSLAIGGGVYLLFVRPVLRPRGHYADRWPAALNIERSLYRPLLTRWLPAVCGTAAGWFARNVLTRRLSSYTVRIASALARALSDSLNALAPYPVRAAAILARALSDSTDALVVLLRRTVVREVKPRDGSEPLRVGRIHALRRASDEALSPFLESFSFAMLMTCVGIILFLGMLVWLLR